MKKTVDLARTPPLVGWGVRIDQEAVVSLAERWKDEEFPSASWSFSGVPPDLAGDSWCNFTALSISVIGCLWPPEGESMWQAEHLGEWLEDAPALFSRFTRVLAAGELDLERFRTNANDDGFFDGRGVLQLIPERHGRLQAVTTALDREWGGQASALVTEAESRARPLADLLARRIPGYRDEVETPHGWVRFDKLAQLAAAMIASRIELVDLEQLTVYPDYIVPAVLRRYGILKYDPALASKIDRRRVLAVDSRWEIAIRWATVFVGAELVRQLNARGNPVIAAELDYRLWHSGVLGEVAPKLGEHHRVVRLEY